MGDDRSRGAAAASRSISRNKAKSHISDLLRASNDIVLIVDDGGVVRDLVIEDHDLAREIGTAWIDQPLVETVTIESRGKVQRMLDGAGAGLVRQEINHVVGDEDLPVRYAAVRLAPDGPVAVLGRDLRDIARLQQQLVEANLAVERDYALHRATEIQFRILFQHAAQAVVIADAASRRVLDVNPRAEDVLRRTARQLAGTEFEKLFAEAGADAIRDGFAAARAVGQTAWPALALRQSGANAAVAGWLIRSSARPQILLRLSTPSEDPPPPTRFGTQWEALRHLPEPLVATDDALLITDANASFLDLIGAETVERVRGEPLARYLGRHALDPVLSRLEDAGRAHGVNVSWKDRAGARIEGEVSSSLIEGDQLSYCFIIRPLAAMPGDHGSKTGLKAADEMTSLVGRMPLREIVRESADIIEELCIEAALVLTKDNRASAADMLGLSRQSLYAKLRRYGLGNLPLNGSNGEEA